MHKHGVSDSSSSFNYYPLLDSQVVVCVALFDLGEFTRFYPNGRVVVSRLGAKDKVRNRWCFF